MSEQENIRELAFSALMTMEREGQLSHLVLRDMLDKYAYLPRRDRAFLTRLVQGTLERRLELDYIINSFSRTKVSRMKPAIRVILRTGVYQLKYMDAVPASAACNEAVKLARRHGFSGLSGFVNGVLRGISRGMDQMEWPDAVREEKQFLSVRYSMPEWIVERFLRQYGREHCEAILASYLEERPICVWVNQNRCDRQALCDTLRDGGVRVTERGDALRLSGCGSPTELFGFEEGLLFVQDYASMEAVRMAAPKPGDLVLDVCAAPGGKSLRAAALMNDSGTVEARDVSENKVELIRENIARSGMKNLTARVWDAAVFDEAMEKKADLVLADLPCSGLGVIGTKPDIRYNASEEKIAQLAALQRQILDVVCRYVRPGGVLLYSTCTMTPEENEDNTAWFVERHPEFTAETSRQFLPDEGCDGFYAVRFRRHGETDED